MTTQATPLNTIVLIHGLWLTSLSWESWIRRYESLGYRVIAPDWPGMDVGVDALNEDPSAIEHLTITQITDHFASTIAELDRAPIIIGHCIGGAITQVLLDRGLGAAGVAIASAAVKGVRDLPFSTIRAASPGLNPLKRGKPVRLTRSQFQYAFTNTLTQEASDSLYDRYHVPSAGKVLREYALTSFRRNPATKVDFHRADRAPLLFVAFADDHLMPPKVLRHNAKRYDTTTSITQYVEFSARPHFPAVPGWEEVADHALNWAIDTLAKTKSDVTSQPTASDRHIAYATP